MTINNADMPAMPVDRCDADAIEVGIQVFSGFTKREMMAMHILPSLIEAYEIDHVATYGEGVVRDAVIYADLLLAELERTK